MHITRREFIKATTAIAVSGNMAYKCMGKAAAGKPQVRPITCPPKYHWFGYYDKLQFDPDDRFVLGMEVDFEHRTPTADDVIRIGMVDLRNDDEWIELGTSSAWCWQQGCMLQWRPSSDREVLWNDREDDRYVCRILDIQSGRIRTVPRPVYTVSPDGRTAMSVDFERIQDMRPGYGYPGIPDANRNSKAPEDAGVYRIDLETGRSELVFSIAEAVEEFDVKPDFDTAKHYFNHLLFNPDGTRFVFLHRWRPKDPSAYGNVGGFGTRMITADTGGREVCLLDDSGYTSHFIWRDPSHVLAWTRYADAGSGFFLFKDKTDQVSQIGKGVMTRNGHCSYLPGGEWILNDTYPDEDRIQTLYLFNPETGKRIELGGFHSPPEYKGESRVDLHPRHSRGGRKVVIDSTHGGAGRQMYLVDISSIPAINECQ